MKRVLALILCLFTTACSAPLVNPNATPAQVQRDQMECEYEATKAVPDTGMGSALAIGMQRGSLMRQCMQLRGYR